MISKSSNTKIKSVWLKIVSLICVGGALAACTATKGSVSNPILRKFQWFSYIEGGDFRDTCGAGATDQYRLIYNAIHTQQVRIYNISAAPPTLHTRIISRLDLRGFKFNTLAGLLDPWRGQTIDIKLSTSELTGLVQDLEDAGVFAKPNVGEELSSKGFFWTIAACHEGQYHFTGFAWPSEAWAKLNFSDRLFRLDLIDVPINLPRKTVTMRQLSKTKFSGLTPDQEYHLKVGENGLVGFRSLF